MLIRERKYEYLYKPVATVIALIRRLKYQNI